MFALAPWVLDPNSCHVAQGASATLTKVGATVAKAALTLDPWLVQQKICCQVAQGAKVSRALT